MPWKEQTAMSQKLEFIACLAHWEGPFAQLCKSFGISRPTGYKWRKRHAEGGEEGLQEFSRRPCRSPALTSPRVVQEVLAVREEHPAWGGRKIHWRLKGRGHANPPAPSTITDILRRAGRLGEREKTISVRRFEKAFPNQSWQVDFKGHYATTLAGRCHPLTVTDDHSRFNLLLHACPGERRQYVQSGLTAAFRRYGMPVVLQFDNGPPWGSVQNGQRVLTKVACWLIRLGIEVRHIRPHHPQSNGKAERFHRTLQQEVISRQTFSDLRHCQRVFDRWRADYNLRRPHEALAYAVPAARYRPSPRRFPERLPAVEYESGVAVRKVYGNGTVQFKGNSYRIGKALKEEYVALRATTKDGEYAVYYCTQQIGKLTLRGAKHV